MRTLTIFLGMFLGAALVSGLLTYPVWSMLPSFLDVPIHRVMNRMGLLLLAIATIWYLRRHGLTNKLALGYSIPPRQFVRQMLLGFVAGLILIVPLVAVLLGLELRTWSPKLLDNAAPELFAAKLMASALLTGCAVAFIEETFCRGALYAAIQRESGLAVAAVLSTVLYAATHFLGAEHKLPNDDYTYVSGLQIAAKLFERFTHPSDFVDAFLALAAFGALLVLVRLRTGAIAMCVGIHAGAVTIITAIRRSTIVNSEHSLSWLAGNYDGVVGLLACVWIGTVTFVYWRWTRPDREPQPVIVSAPAN